MQPHYWVTLFEGCGVAKDSSFANLITDLENLDAPFEPLFPCRSTPETICYGMPHVTVIASLKHP